MRLDRGAQRVGGASNLGQARRMLGFKSVEIAAAEDAVGPSGEDELAAAPAQDQLGRNSTGFSH